MSNRNTIPLNNLLAKGTRDKNPFFLVPSSLPLILSVIYLVDKKNKEIFWLASSIKKKSITQDCFWRRWESSLSNEILDTEMKNRVNIIYHEWSLPNTSEKENGLSSPLPIAMNAYGAYKSDAIENSFIWIYIDSGKKENEIENARKRRDELMETYVVTRNVEASAFEVNDIKIGKVNKKIVNRYFPERKDVPSIKEIEDTLNSNEPKNQ